jgi:hypothetical protein
MVYQLSSAFNGVYYDKSDNAMRFQGERPFYIWLIGAPEMVETLVRAVPGNRIKGSGVLNRFAVSSQQASVPYAVRVGSGSFTPDRQNPQTVIRDLELTTRGRAEATAHFTIDADFSELSVDTAYLFDVANYVWNLKDYTLVVRRAPSNTHGYTHSLTFACPRVVKGTLDVRLNMAFAPWITATDDEVGAAPVTGKTYGFEHLMRGLYDAFTAKQTASFAELSVSIN